jgi:DNA-binding response OmpR family regulator
MSDVRTVLIVEDEQPLQQAIKVKLEHDGFHTVCARSAEQAMSYLEEMPIDAVWLDHYLLGKEDGLSIVTHMKQDNAKWKNIPIFVVSNTASQSKVQSYLQLGVDKYYTKAENKLEEIIADIRRTLDAE